MAGRGWKYYRNRDEFIPEVFMHILNHANGDENLYRNDHDQYLFLNKLKEKISPFANICSYNLLKNHFHLVIKTPSEEEFIKNIHEHQRRTGKALSYKGYHIEMMQKWNNFFNSYTRNFNTLYDRNGTHFKDSFCHKIFIGEEDIKTLFGYVLLNHVKHYKILNPFDYKHTSLHEHFSKEHSMKITSNDIWDVFKSKEELKEYLDSKLELFLNRVD